MLGRWSFRHLDLAVDRRVLIPRPETEVVAGVAIELARDLPPPIVVADLGTGSGAIGLALADELPLDGVTVWLTDASPDALDVARANLAGIGRRAANVRIAEGRWFDALPAGDDARPRRGQPAVRAPTGPPTVDDAVREWEPHDALFAGPDGLDDIRAIVAAAPRHVRPGGWLVLEIGADQGAAVERLLVDGGVRRRGDPTRPRRARPRRRRPPPLIPTRRRAAQDPRLVPRTAMDEPVRRRGPATRRRRIGARPHRRRPIARRRASSCWRPAGGPGTLFDRGPFTSDFYDAQARALSRGHLDRRPARRQHRGVRGRREDALLLRHRAGPRPAADQRLHPCPRRAPRAAQHGAAGWPSAASPPPACCSGPAGCARRGGRRRGRGRGSRACSPPPSGSRRRCCGCRRARSSTTRPSCGARRSPMLGFERVIVWWSSRRGRDLRRRLRRRRPRPVDTRGSSGIGPALALGGLAVVLAWRRAWRDAAARSSSPPPCRSLLYALGQRGCASARRSRCRSTARCSTTSRRPAAPRWRTTTTRCSALKFLPTGAAAVPAARHGRRRGRWPRGCRGTVAPTSSATSRSTPSTARRRCRWRRRRSSSRPSSGSWRSSGGGCRRAGASRLLAAAAAVVPTLSDRLHRPALPRRLRAGTRRRGQRRRAGRRRLGRPIRRPSPACRRPRRPCCCSHRPHRQRRARRCSPATSTSCRPRRSGGTSSPPSTTSTSALGGGTAARGRRGRRARVRRRRTAPWPSSATATACTAATGRVGAARAARRRLAAGRRRGPTPGPVVSGDGWQVVLEQTARVAGGWCTSGRSASRARRSPAPARSTSTSAPTPRSRRWSSTSTTAPYLEAFLQPGGRPARSRRLGGRSRPRRALCASLQQRLR